jgi:enoyl-CoA hydratase/carnithine racemase
MYSPFLSLLQIEVPIIGALNGHAIGGGLGLALVCDLRVANRDAKYGANFVRLGLHPGMATTYLMPRLVGLPRALELLLTGRIISGAEAAEIGLANHAVAADQVMERSMELATEIASAAPIAVRMCKQSIYDNVSWDPVKAARAEAHAQSRTLETQDSREGIKALLDKRAPDFRNT